MTLEKFTRTELLLGSEAMEKLSHSRVIVFGLGGVGGYVVEALVRSGIGAIDLVDSDVVDITNLNRQIIATEKTIGIPKVEAAKARILEINPDIRVVTHNIFYTQEAASSFNFADYDYIVDAIDTVSAKLSLIEEAKKVSTPIICSMGTGNKLNPAMLEVSDISKTSVCPLARVIRTELKKRKIKDVKVVYSKEIPIKPAISKENLPAGKHRIPGSTSFVPPTAGLIIAGEVVKDLIS